MRIRSFVAALLLAGCSPGTPEGAPATPGVPAAPTDLPPPPSGGFDPPVTVTFEGAPPIRAEVARRSDQRARGLMQRTELAEGTGMIFLFPRRVDVGFWMKGTLIPLSIAYVDGDRVVSVHEMEPCRVAQCQTYEPARSYTAAVEAPGGFFPRHNVRAGTRMTVTGATTPPES